MDAHAKLGSKFILNDPHPQSKNGKLLENLIEDNDLVVVNGSALCEGLINRKRVTVASTEESILDYFIVCKEMFNRILRMKIDKERKYSLTKYSTTKGKQSIKESDHNPLILEISVSWDSKFVEKSTRTEVFNFSEDESFSKYQLLTETNKELINCFDDEEEDLQVSRMAQDFSKCHSKIFQEDQTHKVQTKSRT